jgi:ribulose-bisphosphate carboxylase large chain
MGGFDLSKDDENLSSTSFNNFFKRVELMSKLRDRAEKLTGERKDALLNITAETKEMEKRAKFLHNHGWKYAMIDVVTCGFSSVQTLRHTLGDYNMAIHAHRAMHASFDRNSKHGLTMLFLAKLMRLIGVDQIHAGTGVGKLVGSKHEIMDIAKTLRNPVVQEENHKMLYQNWNHIKPAFPVSSGGLHPGLVPDVMNFFGNDCAILVSGGIHGHPKGTRAGAKATMQAIDAVKEGTSLEEKARSSPELKLALNKWGHLHPK